VDNETDITPDQASADSDTTAPKRTSRRAKTDAVITPDTPVATGPADKPARKTATKKADSEAADSGDRTSVAEAADADAPARTTRSRTRNGAKAPQDADATDQDVSEGAGEGSDDDGDQDSGHGRGRGRGRGRDRRRGRNGDDVDPEVSDDDVLIPIGGILDILDNYAFVRTTGYLPGPTDIYVSLGQVKKYNLRKGDAVIGAIRQPREGESQGRQKYNALVSVDSVNAKSVDEAANRPEFHTLTPVHPTSRLQVETGSDKPAMRLVDLFAPLAKGQRGVILAPPKSGKSTLIQGLAESIANGYPDIHLMVVVVDENPETVTELQRVVKGEVIASTFDRPADDHTTIAELAIERAKRLVELGHDVVVIVDSITRLARAYQLTGTHSRGSAQADVAWLYPTKRLVGSGRQIENGGSLTVLGTVLADTGQDIDAAIAHEITQLATTELVLDAGAARARMFPALDVVRSSTARDEVLLGANDATVLDEFRRQAVGHQPREVLSYLTEKLAKNPSADALVEAIQKDTPRFTTEG
jgi:transcription termination factor Rho